MNLVYQDGLESQRLKTRWLSNSDAEVWSAFFEDLSSLEFLPMFLGKPSRESAVYWIDKQIERYQEKRFGHQALIHQETNQFVGQAGLLLQIVDGTPELEIGYHIMPEFRGMGYASEAAAMFKEFAFENRISPSVISIINVNNAKSRKVAIRNGMQPSAETTLADEKVVIYRIVNEDTVNLNQSIKQGV